MTLTRLLCLSLICMIGLGTAPAHSEPVQLLNVSYDPTREFYEEYNRLFAAYWQKKSGEQVEILQAHGGSGKQARAVIEGLPADVVTLALGYDIDMIASRSGSIAENWQKKFPYASTPSNSIIVFLVRKDNPKKIKTWDDLVRDDVKVITPNPKISGGARWNYMAAWGYGLSKGGEKAAMDYVRKLFRNVPILDAGARGATTTFVKRGMGDVLIAWESEAKLALVKNPGELEIVIPPLSIRAEPPVAVVDRVVEKKKTREVAEAYLNYLYSDEAQELAVKHFYRPAKPAIMQKHEKDFPSTKLLTIEDFGGWEKAQAKHFGNDGTFDMIFETIGE